MKKIMFNDRYDLTAALLSGRKTVTRREVWNQIGNLDGVIYYTKTGSDLIYARANFDNGISEDCPYAIGEIVAVAQSYKELDNEWCRNHVGVHPAESPYSSCENMAGWNNKIFVRADLMPHRIQITDIRAERLQDITDEDCLQEGIWQAYDVGLNGETYWFKRCVNSIHRTPRSAYAALIDKISGPGTWKRNPFVWRIEFKLVK